MAEREGGGVMGPKPDQTLSIACEVGGHKLCGGLSQNITGCGREDYPCQCPCHRKPGDQIPRDSPMTFLYYVDAETRSSEGVVSRDFHLQTPSVEEAEHAFLDCWFKGGFWSVSMRMRIRKENEKAT